MSKPAPSGDSAYGRLLCLRSYFIPGWKASYFREVRLQTIIHIILPAGDEATENPDPRLNLKGSHLNESPQSHCRAPMFPAAQGDCEGSCWPESSFPFTHRNIQVLSGFCPSPCCNTSFFSQFFWSLGKQQQCSSAVVMVGFCPNLTQLRWSCCCVSFPQFSKITYWEESRGCTTSSAWRNLHSPILWASLHRLPKMDIKEPQSGDYFLPKTILKITNTRKLVTCSTSVWITWTFCL